MAAVTVPPRGGLALGSCMRYVSMRTTASAVLGRPPPALTKHRGRPPPGGWSRGAVPQRLQDTGQRALQLGGLWGLAHQSPLTRRGFGEG